MARLPLDVSNALKRQVPRVLKNEFRKEFKPKFEKLKKKFALNNSYFKNRQYNAPSNPCAPCGVEALFFIAPKIKGNAALKADAVLFSSCPS